MSSNASGIHSEGQLLTNEILGYDSLILVLCRRCYRNAASKEPDSGNYLHNMHICDRDEFGQVLS